MSHIHIFELIEVRTWRDEISRTNRHIFVKESCSREDRDQHPQLPSIFASQSLKHLKSFQVDPVELAVIAARKGYSSVDSTFSGLHWLQFILEGYICITFGYAFVAVGSAARKNYLTGPSILNIFLCKLGAKTLSYSDVLGVHPDLE